MKFAFILWLSLLSLPTFAGPGDEPIVPWPTSASPKSMLVEDIQGNWYAFGENRNTLWLISIVPHPKKTDEVVISITSNGLFGKEATGIGKRDKNLFWSLIRFNPSHAAGLVIFRDREYFVLRISRDKPGQVEEMQLFRGKP